MNLTRKQITIVVASLLVHQKEYRENSEMYKDINELIELLDQEHQKIMEHLENLNETDGESQDIL